MPSPQPECSSVAHRDVQVCVPVSVKPFANILNTTVRCCGKPIFATECQGMINGTCDFNIMQRICVEIPVEFGAEIETDEVKVACMETLLEPCSNCPRPDPTDPDPIDPEDPDA